MARARVLISARPVASIAASEHLFGLDLVRTVAIGLVILAHGAGFPGNPLSWTTIPTATLGWITGVVGVELFFSLSGFLIGTLLLALEADGLGWASARIFLVRRWMRTLPLYYLVLVAIIAFPAGDPEARPGVWQFAALVQNALTPMPESGWFGTSWSLVIEEWSYILVPLLAGLVFRRARHPLLYAAAALCVAGFACRFAALQVTGDWDTTVRKLLLTRLDAIAYGLILAWLWRTHRGWTRRWATRVAPVSLPLFAASIWLLSGQTRLDWLYCRVFGLPVFAVLVCMLMPVIMSLRAPQPLAATLRWIAGISYAVYLVHWSVRFLVLDVAPAWQFAAYLAVTLLAAAALTRWVEQPVMRLRPRQV